jgi:hypothetical protein
MGLDGPSRTIEITPVKIPATEPRKEPAPGRRTEPEREREREKVPAGV